MIKLFVDALYTSPYAMSVYVALREKGVDFTVETVDLQSGGTQAAGFAAQSLTRRVPTLVGDDFSLTESSAITEYLDEVFTHGTRLYPTDALQRARCRQVQAWLRSDLLALRQERSTEVIFCGLKPQPLSPAGQAAAHKLIDVASGLIAPGQATIAAQWSLADVDLALMLHRLIMSHEPVPEHLKQYATAHWQRSSVQAWVKQPRAAHAAA